MLENSPIDTTVEKLIATDADSGVNAEVKYRIQKGAFDDFNISDDGVVTVAKKLDFDRRNTYNIEVIGVDQGTPSLTGTTTLTISIINSNDKLPYFVPATQRAEVSTKKFTVIRKSKWQYVNSRICRELDVFFLNIRIH